jgi:hypothetical protein
MGLVTPRKLIVHRVGPVLVTAAIFALILRRVPFAAVEVALRDANLPWFLALMIANTIFYFAWPGGRGSMVPRPLCGIVNCCPSARCPTSWGSSAPTWDVALAAC